MGLWKAFCSNAGAAEIGLGLFFALICLPLYPLVYPLDYMWVRVAISGLLGIGAARILSFNIECINPTDEKMRRWVFGVYSGLWFGTWSINARLDDEGLLSIIISLLASGGGYGGIMVAMNRAISLEKAGEHGYDIAQSGRGFHSMWHQLLMAPLYVMLALNLSRLLSHKNLADDDLMVMLFCANIAFLLAWVPRAYQPLEMGRLGSVALAMRLALSFAVIVGVAAPFFLG